MTRGMGMGSKEQDFLLDLAIKRMTSSLRAENESKRAEHIEADCGLEQVASSVQMRLIFCTKKFPMSIANILTPPKFKLKLVGAGFVFSPLRKCTLWKSAKGLCSRKSHILDKAHQHVSTHRMDTNLLEDSRQAR